MDTSLQSALWLAALPLVAILALGLNVFIRASGRRSIHMSLKAFGIELKIDSDVDRSDRK